MPENLIEHFEDTLHRCESGALRDATRQAMEGTKVYREDFRVQQPLMPRYERRITVEDTTTFAAAARFGNQYGVAVLNFANPEVPGGGVKNGATRRRSASAAAAISIRVWPIHPAYMMTSISITMSTAGISTLTA